MHEQLFSRLRTTRWRDRSEPCRIVEWIRRPTHRPGRHGQQPVDDHTEVSRAVSMTRKRQCRDLLSRTHISRNGHWLRRNRLVLVYVGNSLSRVNVVLFQNTRSSSSESDRLLDPPLLLVTLRVGDHNAEVGHISWQSTHERTGAV